MSRGNRGYLLMALLLALLGAAAIWWLESSAVWSGPTSPAFASRGRALPVRLNDRGCPCCPDCGCSLAAGARHCCGCGRDLVEARGER